MREEELKSDNALDKKRKTRKNYAVKNNRNKNVFCYFSTFRVRLKKSLNSSFNIFNEKRRCDEALYHLNCIYTPIYFFPFSFFPSIHLLFQIVYHK